MELHFLQAAWSDIIILKEGGYAAMVDTGFGWQYPFIELYLHQMGVSRLSFLLLTHFHRDHYGALPDIVRHFRVEKVYFKDYSGLEAKTATGTPADDAYREAELRKCADIKELIEKNSRLIPAETADSIEWCGHHIHLFHAENTIRQIYEDRNYPNTWGQPAFSENQNSLAAFFKVNGVRILLAGDVMDLPSSHPSANYVNNQIASALGERIDIYKVPHHGTNCCNSKSTLAIYRPRIAVITNGEEYIKERSEICQDLRQANHRVRILLTERQTVVIRISETGEIAVNGEETAG